MNVVVNNGKRERQKQYRERNRDKLKHREAETRKRLQSSQSIIGPSSSSNSNIMEVNNEEPVTAISSTLQNRRDCQKRYREKNRDKLKRREAERRKRLQSSQSIIGPSTSSNLNIMEVNNEEPVTAISSTLQNRRDCQKRYREKNRDKLKHCEAERRKRLQSSQSVIGPSTSSNSNIMEVNNEESVTAISSTLQNKRDYQKRYREKNRDKLKHREAERRKRIQSSQSIIGPSTSSNSNIMEVNNEESVTAISSTLQKRRDCQKRYREKNREKLSQREAERRRRLQNAESIIELHTSPNIGNREIITEPIIIIEEVSTNSRNLTGLGEMEHEVFDISQQNSSNLSSLNIAAIPNNYSQFSYHKTAHEYFIDNFKNNEFGHACSLHCIAKFKRQNVRDAGVAIYKNNNISHVTTLNMDLAIQNTTEVHVSQTSIGDICASHVKLEEGSELIMIVVYISPNNKMDHIISFLHERLFPYSQRGSTIFKTNKHKLPIILAGDFNVNFTRAESMPLITFLQKEFQLQINNNPRESTTKYGTTIDAVFVRYLDDVSSSTFVTYFSYHRPIVTAIPAEETSNITITEVTDENI